MMYEIKYKELPNNLSMVQVKLKEKTIIYINIKKDRTLGKVNYQDCRK